MTLSSYSNLLQHNIMLNKVCVSISVTVNLLQPVLTQHAADHGDEARSHKLSVMTI